MVLRKLLPYSALVLSWLVAPAWADTLILLDNSGSMAEPGAGGVSKAAEAAQALSRQLIPALPDKERTGLWAFGGGCRGFQFQGSLGSKVQVRSDLKGLHPPVGSTPLTHSIGEALKRLKSASEPRRLLVVTDGMDTCGGDPCAEVRRAGAFSAKITIHTVGLGMPAQSGPFRVLQCIADASFQGSARATDAGGLKGAIDDLAPVLVEPKGELLVQVTDAAGEEQLGVSYVVRSLKDGVERRGESGKPQELPAGTYRVESGDAVASEVTVKPGERTPFDFKSDLGRLVVAGACAEGLGFVVEDRNGRTVHTGQGGESIELDLPPGRYKVTLTGYPRLQPLEVAVEKSRHNFVSLPDFGTLRVEGRDAAGRELDLALEIFDDRFPNQALPVANGETNRDFQLPAGVYNVRVSPDDPRARHFRGGENVQVRPCQKTQAMLRQRAVLLVCGKGPVGIWSDSSGKFISARAGEETPLEPGRYNLKLPDGRRVFNFRVVEGVNKAGCN